MMTHPLKSHILTELLQFILLTFLLLMWSLLKLKAKRLLGCAWVSLLNIIPPQETGLYISLLS